MEKKFRYRGSSMLPTLTPGQVLYLHPKGHSPEPGDVIVYCSRGQYVVHRVKNIRDGVLITRGDNNPHDDTDPVNLDQIVGVVDHKDNWGKLEPVRGGTMALLFAKTRWKLSEVYTRLLPWLGAPYRWLKAHRWINWVWHPDVTTIHLQTPDGVMVKYVVRGRTVATWWPEKSQFTSQKPYDLVIFPPK